MYLTKLDVSGDFDLNLPRNEVDLLALAESYVVYEATLSPDEVLHDISCADIQAALSRAQTAQAAQRASETDRAIAAAQLQIAYRHVRPLLDRVILHLKSRHVDNLADLEQWGLKTKVGPHGPIVLKPVNPLDWLDFLNAFVAQESGRLPADQISDPSLSELAEWAEKANRSRQERDAARIQREINTAARHAAVHQLRQLLLVAASIRIVKQYQGCVSVELGKWGYPVMARK